MRGGGKDAKLIFGATRESGHTATFFGFDLQLPISEVPRAQLETRRGRGIAESNSAEESISGCGLGPAVSRQSVCGAATFDGDALETARANLRVTPALCRYDVCGGGRGDCLGRRDS